MGRASILNEYTREPKRRTDCSGVGPRKGRLQQY